METDFSASTDFKYGALVIGLSLSAVWALQLSLVAVWFAYAIKSENTIKSERLEYHIACLHRDLKVLYRFLAPFRSVLLLSSFYLWLSLNALWWAFTEDRNTHTRENYIAVSYTATTVSVAPLSLSSLLSL